MCNHDTDTCDEGARPASRPISSSDVGDDMPPGVSCSGAPMTIEAPAAIAIASSSGPMRPHLALLPAPPTMAVAASAGTGELGWSTSYSRGRGRGRGRANWRDRVAGVVVVAVMEEIMVPTEVIEDVQYAYM